MEYERQDQSTDLPQQFGKYELVERLAVGGMAEIFLAQTTGIGGFEKTLVIKKLHDRHAQDDGFIDMMVDEAKIAVQLNHPNIGQVFDLGRIRDQYYIAMEYIEGPDLGRVMEFLVPRGDRLPVPAVLFIGAECCSGLHYAHTRTDDQGRSLRIVHRDVSPPNVMLSLEGEVKIVDFGIAKARKRVQETEHGAIKGKFHYMAPEQARGQRVDARTDVFSVGMVLYELLGGRNPYEDVPESEMVEAARRAEIPPLRHYRPKIDPELDQVIMHALQPSAEDRYRSAAEFDRALTDYRERKCEPYDRRRLSALVKDLWSEMGGRGATHASPSEETGSMTPYEFQADESSMIREPEEGGGEAALHGEASLEGEDLDGSGFDEEAPTEIWEGGGAEGDGGGQQSRTGGQAAGESGALGAVDDESLPPPPDDEMEFETVDEPAAGNRGRRSSDAPDRPAEASASGSVAASKADTTESGRASGGLPGPLAKLVDRLESAGIDRRAQLYAAVVLFVGFAGTFAIALYAIFSGASETKRIRGSAEPRAEKAKEGSSTLRVESEPSGAVVRVDGEKRGETPLGLEELRSDETYRIEVSHENYRTGSREVVPSEQSGALKFELEKAEGVLQVSTYPPDARVELDGETIGYSPVTASNVSRAKSHELVAHLDGEQVKRTVEWADGDETVKEIRLEFESVEGTDEEERAAEDREEERRRHARRTREDRNHGSNESESNSDDDTTELNLFDDSEGGGGGSSESGSSGGSGGSGGGGGSGKSDENTAELDIWGSDDESGGSSGGSGGESGGKGYLSVQVKKGWGRVFVDGQKVAAETPLINYSLKAGSHKVKVYYPVLKRSSKVRTVRIRSGKTKRVIFKP